MSEPNGGACLIPDGAGRLRVEGPLDFTTVSGLLAAGEERLRDTDRLQIDLAGVTSANSAGLALLLEWLDLARARGVALRYLNLPDSLMRIAAFSNLETLLPVGADGP